MRKCILENEQKFYFHSVYKNYAAGKNGEIMNVRLKKKKHLKEYRKWWLLNDWNIYISKKEKQKVFLCHRFIWDVFNGLRPEDRFIDQNNDRKDNRLEHFQLLTRKENHLKS